MHLTITVAIIVIAVLVIAAYFYASGRMNLPSGTVTNGGVVTGSAADQAALNSVDQALNAATQNTSTSKIESAIAAQ